VSLDPADTRASYDRVAEAYAARFDDELDGKPLDRALLEFLPELAELDRRPGVVADLGSGPGQIGRHVRRCSGLPVVAVDLSPAMASLALGRHAIPAAAGSLTSLPLADGSVGAAVVFYCFIHLDDDGLRAAAVELHRVLRPRGVAIVAVHTGDEVRHVETLVDTAVDLDFRFLPVATLDLVLVDAGLSVEAVLERTGVAGVESETRRAYVVVRRPL
jgi:SAM-dependent methyltransferase